MSPARAVVGACVAIVFISAASAAPESICSDSEYCCPDAKACLKPTNTSCLHSSSVCTGGTFCCPVTKLCVTAGAPCKSPCPGMNDYCCPDAKHCLTPVNPGVLCKTSSDCNSGDVCCPVTKVCVSVGEACTPPLNYAEAVQMLRGN